MFYSTVLLLAFQFPSQAHPSQGTRPCRVAKAEMPLYDSTKMDLSASPGISHKTAMQAARTYGKIGVHKPLNHDDTVFLRKWSPDIIGPQDDAPEKTPVRPVAKAKR